jgi:signal transduction histidine kinase
MEAGKMRFEIVPTDLALLIRQCLDANDGLARSYEVRFVLQQCVDARVNADPYRLQQVLANLLSNAAKFSPRGAEVHIAMHAKPDAVRVEVSDRGPGVPEEFRGRLFEKFSQADSSDTRSKGGTGLGLAVCKAIIDALGGTIGYQTNANGGATFFFELPYAR